MADRQVEASDPYIEKLKKLVPAEVSAAFLAINSLIPLNAEYNVYLELCALALITACWLYLKQSQQVTALPQLLFTSLVAFPVWAMNIALPRFDWLADKSFIPASILIIVTIFAPLIPGPRNPRSAN